MTKEKEYRAAGYASYKSGYDSEEAALMRCEKCKSTCHYVGLKRFRPATHYVALAVCDNCGHEVEF